MKCPYGTVMCTTCRLAKLIRCPSLGTPLPLVEGEKRRVWPDESLTQQEREALYRYMRDHGSYE